MHMMQTKWSQNQYFGFWQTYLGSIQSTQIMGSESWVLIAPGLQSPVPVQVTVSPSVRRAFRAACSRCVIRFDNDIISPNHEGVFLIKCSTAILAIYLEACSQLVAVLELK